MAKYDRSSQVPSDDAQCTDVKIINSSGQTLVKKAVIIWEGSIPDGIPNQIPSGLFPKGFSHEADAVVGLEYKFIDNATLIIAWSKKGESNRVYAGILQAGAAVDCDQIKRHLDESDDHTIKNFSFECIITVDSNNGMLKVEVILQKAT